MQGFGVQAVVNIIIQLVFIIVTWWALQTFRLDIFLKNPNSPQAKTLLILLTIAIGSLVGNFFINYLDWATRLRYLF